MKRKQKTTKSLYSSALKQLTCGEKCCQCCLKPGIPGSLFRPWKTISIFGWNFDCKRVEKGAKWAYFWSILGTQTHQKRHRTNDAKNGAKKRTQDDASRRE